MTLNNMGIVNDNLGRHEEALVAYSQALAIKEDLYGKDHPTVGATLSDTGIALHKRERHAEAVAVHNRALAIQREMAWTPPNP